MADAIVRATDRSAPMEQRIAAYLRTGSVEPLEGRCGARRRRPPDFPKDAPWRYCKGTPVPGHRTRRCSSHGGRTPMGPASPHFRHGRAGRYGGMFEPGSPLYEGYHAPPDETLVGLQEQIQLCDAREAELVGEIVEAHNGQAKGWAEAKTAVQQLREAINRQDTVAFAKVADRLEKLTTDGAGYDSIWDRWVAITELRRKLEHTQARLIETGQRAVTVEQAMAYGAKIASLATTAMMGDSKRLAVFTASLRRLQEGREVEDAAVARAMTTKQIGAGK